jgi:DNA-binding Lrp family transcriptional regulator
MPKRTNTDLNGATTAGPGGVPPLDEKSQRILAALAELGAATAAGLAERVGIGYSTTTPKLRKLHTDGLAEATKADNGQAVWRLTATGAAHPAATRTEANTANEAATDTVAQRDTAHPQTTDGMTTEDVQAEPETVEKVTAEGKAVAEVDVDAQDADESAGSAVGTVAAEGGGMDNTEHTDSMDTATSTAITAAITADGGSADGDPAVEAAHGAPGEAPADASAAHATDDSGIEPQSVGAASADEPSEADASAGTSAASADSAASEDGNGTPAVRRAPGSLDTAILAILQARPANVFKVGELCKLINNAEAGTGVSKASPGAVVLAAQRLVARRQAILAVEKPASFQLLPGTADEPTCADQPDTANAEAHESVVTAG